MKRTFFALALLVPALASAAVTVELDVAHESGNTAEESFEFAEVGDSAVVTPTECGAEVSMELEQEGDEAATFKVTVVQDGETKCESDVSLTYGQAHTFECKKACFGSVTMTASQS